MFFLLLIVDCSFNGLTLFTFFYDASSYEAHYNSLHRHSCQKCQRSFPSTHLLEIHVLENHDTLFSMIATRKNLVCILINDLNMLLTTLCAQFFWKNNVINFKLNHLLIYDKIMFFYWLTDFCVGLGSCSDILLLITH